MEIIFYYKAAIRSNPAELHNVTGRLSQYKTGAPIVWIRIYQAQDLIMDVFTHRFFIQELRIIFSIRFFHSIWYIYLKIK